MHLNHYALTEVA